MKEIAIDRKEYDGLMAVSRWYEAMPTNIPNRGGSFRKINLTGQGWHSSSSSSRFVWSDQT